MIRRHLLQMLCVIALFVTSSGMSAIAQNIDQTSGMHSFNQRLSAAPCPPTPPPGVPVPPGCDSGSSQFAHMDSGHARICVQLKTDLSNSILHYQLVARNSGSSDARNLTVDIPLTPDLSNVVGVTFSAKEAWVRRVLSNTMELQLGRVDPTNEITATVDIAVTSPKPSVKRALFRWSDASGGGVGVTNQTTSNAQHELSITPEAGNLTSTFQISFDGFTSREVVGLWQQGLDGLVEPLFDLIADTDGHILVEIPASRLPLGRSVLVAQGECSQQIAIGVVVVSI